MKKVVLVYPKINFEDNYPNSWIPFSILSLATSIQDKNLDIYIFDQNKSDTKEYYKYLEQNHDDILCVAFSIMTGGAQIKNALELASKAKDYNISTAFGGPHVNVLSEQTCLHNLVDYSLKGLGQFQFPVFIDALQGNSEMKDVPGIYYYENEKLIKGPDNIPNVRNLPNYNLNLIDVSKYIQNDNTINDRTINYISSQGCPYTCKFCYETCYKRKYLKIKESGVNDDLDFLINTYNVNGIKFYDADFFVDSQRSIALSNKLKRMGIKWAASINPRDILRAQKGEENELLRAISEGGCTRLLMGMESGNERVLKEIVDKRVTVDELRYVADLISKYKILGSYTFIVGFPGETQEEINDTLNFAKSLWELDYAPETRVHIYMPYPGTELFDKAVSLGFVSPDSLEGWSEFDYYKAMTPWTDKSLESEVKKCTRQIEKKLKKK